MIRPRVGVLLAGCGVYDGAEIHEAVVTLLALDREGAEPVCLAPAVAQHHVVNHLTGQAVAGERRDVLEEAARIARGAVRDVAGVSVSELDALVIPGGFGAAKNLCSFAFEGASCSVLPAVEALVRALHEAGKPIGAMCIAPVILARVLGARQPRLTVGNDAATAAALESLGARHVPCAAEDIVIDEAARLVSTPAYMLAGTIGEAAAGIEKLVAEVLRMARG